MRADLTLVLRYMPMWLDDPFRSVIAATILLAAAVTTIAVGMSIVDLFV